MKKVADAAQMSEKQDNEKSVYAYLQAADLSIFGSSF